MSYSTGVLGYEHVTLPTYEGVVVMPFVVFGCGRNNNFVPQIPQSSGVFGLGADNPAIVRSTRPWMIPKCSYCVGNITDLDNTYNQLVLGYGAILQGQSTPTEIRNGLYDVSLDGIKVGRTDITINPEEYNFSVIVASRTTMSYLHGSTFEFLKMEAQYNLDPKLQCVEEGNPDILCYLGDLRRDVVPTFPVVTFRLAKGAQVDVDVEGMFYQRSPSDFCIAVIPTDDNHAVIGILVQ